MSVWPAFIEPGDLAPGDRMPHPELPDGIRLHVIEASDDPLFETAFGLLERQFSHAGEMETREVITERLRWNLTPATGGHRLRYELLLLMVAGECVGVRDHTIIATDREITVHLSHVLVPPLWRRRGLASLLRTLPATGARLAADRLGLPQAPVTLLCEMEPFDPASPANIIRRRSYDSAGFLSIPSIHGYMQPDFRSPEKIDADPAGPRPVPFDLIFRRVGREDERSLSGAELIAHVGRLYAMYQASFEPRHMEPCHRWLADFQTRCPERLPLISPIPSS